jgi:hypothetical protein
MARSTQEGEVMKLLMLFGVLAGAGLLFSSSGGCSGVAYSQAERDALISRTWNVDGREMVDDFDSLLLLRPPSRMTIWHVR